MRLYSLSESSLIIKQIATALTLRRATGWRMGRWISSLNRLFRVAAGAYGAGCFGYPPHPVLEVTNRCNMRCIHCEVRGGEVRMDPPLENVFKMIDSIATIPEFKMLVLTGGDPLMNSNILEIIDYARSYGFEIVVATNGTLISENMARELSRRWVAGVAVSLDFIEPKLHDYFRGVPGTWIRTMEGVRNSLREKLYLQVNITISKLNLHELPSLLYLADMLGAHVILLYQFQPFGRGLKINSEMLGRSEFLKVIETTINIQKKLNALIVPIGLPEYFAYLSGKVDSRLIHGCIAGKGMFYVKWYGEVWPCVFLQVGIGNIIKEPAVKIWRGNKILAKLRNRENLEGPCKSCIHREICGGCRSRAYLLTGNIFASDPLCPFINIYKPITTIIN
jgi:radical SAM protein with 4Fe4S-binding SPASM domain